MIALHGFSFDRSKKGKVCHHGDVNRSKEPSVFIDFGDSPKRLAVINLQFIASMSSRDLDDNYTFTRSSSRVVHHHYRAAKGF